MSSTNIFEYQNGQLFCEGRNVDELAKRVGTPFYLYSKKAFLDQYNAIRDAFSAIDPLVCYSVKTCGNINILAQLIDAGAGMDVVSGGELFRALEAGADPKNIVFAGIGKTDAEIEYALEMGIGWFNIESEAEFENISRLAKEKNVSINAALRINPDVYDSRTHEKTMTGHRGSKFGVDIERATDFVKKASSNQHCKVNGIHFHLGSPIYTPEPYALAIGKVMILLGKLKNLGIHIDTINIGGGYAADYTTGLAPQASDYADAIIPLLTPFVAEGGRVIMEPGRSISASSGVLISKVVYLKEGGGKKFAVLDAGMSQLIRPALYDAFHFIWPTKVDALQVPKGLFQEMDLPGLEKYHITGPICESSDYLARDRSLPRLKPSELICIFTCGAYGMVMASQYNAVPRPPEILVDGEEAFVIRERETLHTLTELERHKRTI